MQVEMKEVHDPKRKSEICDYILRALPSWFGVEASIVEYTEKVKDMPFCAVFAGEMPVGFVPLKEHNLYTAEVCVMGVLPGYHRQGLGKKLISWCEARCLESRREFLTVKTLDESRASKSYEKTRLFYLSVGFRPLEVFPLFWDEDNPCLFLVKHIGGQAR